MQKRQLIVLSGDNQWLAQQVLIISQLNFDKKEGVYFYQKDSQSLLLDKFVNCPFQLAKNILGQENDWIIFDIRFGFNLDALAIAEGTLKAGGILFILTNDWQHLSSQLDLDSQRWADGKIITPTNFFDFFKISVNNYKFPIYEQSTSDNNTSIPLLLTESRVIEEQCATVEQQQIIDHILAKQSDIFIITAKRGRGKSALAGFLAQKLLIENPQQLLVTAPNKKAIQILQRFSNIKIPFIAPDTLLEQLENNPNSIVASFLIIDEAAMIPLPMLEKLISYFKHVICTTTIQSYEGTGRGFMLKFVQKIHRPFSHFELQKPLRWLEDDPLEKFIEDLLLLNETEEQPYLADNKEVIQLEFYSQINLIKENFLAKFYQLLSLAHYRTSPSDLRRLFDAEDDLFFLAKQEQNLLGGIWSIIEGDLKDQELIKAIQRGERRPRGNLVAQLLSQYTNFDEACLLRSTRISRIAVQPYLQGKGIGQDLVKNFCQQLQEQKEIDFISVSFGYEEKLMQFWQKCGFQIVYLSENKIASSGCYSVVALYGLTSQGHSFVEKVVQLFQRNFPLIKHPLKNILNKYIEEQKIDYFLNQDDISMLQNFANYHRPLFSTIPSILRLLKQDKSHQHSVLKEYFQDPSSIKNYLSYKQWLYCCRQEIQKKLMYFLNK